MYQSQLLHMQDDNNIISNVATENYTNSTLRFNNIDASLNYKRTFSKEDQELEIAVNTSLGTNYNTTDNYQLALPSKEQVYGNNSHNPGHENVTEVQADYTQPFKKDVRLSIGTKFNVVDIASNADVLSFEPATQSYEPTRILSNSLTYRQKVYAAYSELSLPVGNLFDARFGGRYERTEINSFYSNAQQQVSAPGYNTFVPSLFLSRKLDEKNMVKLSYSKRIERPDYGDLNPFINTSDPKNITTGNPVPGAGNRQPFRNELQPGFGQNRLIDGHALLPC